MKVDVYYNPRRKFLMASDKNNAQSARVHIQAAKSAPRRKELELNQAANFARLIKSASLRKEVEDEISRAR